MIKPGMLLQWKSTDKFRWGWHYKEKPSPTVENDNIFFRIMKKVRIQDEEILNENIFLLKLLQLEQEKLAEITQVTDDEHKFHAFKKISFKYLLKEKEIENKIFYFQYALMAIDKLVHTYKVGNVILKEKIYWQCMLTKRNGDTLNIWVEEDDVEPYVENSYDIKNILLAKHLARRAAKKK